MNATCPAFRRGLVQFQSVFFSMLCCSICACADMPDAPIVMKGSNGVGLSSPEICGDGVDQDLDGADLACSGDDKDRDGFVAGIDCDDFDRHIIPGAAANCSAACGEGTQICQSNGTFTACSCQPFCEAVEGGKCYYISAATGDDTNTGAFNAPWRTYRNIVSYYSEADKTSRWVQLKAGDVVYFMSGVYSFTYNYNNIRKGLFLRGVSGTATVPVRLRAYPGMTPVISPTPAAEGIDLLQVNNVRLEGLEVTQAYQAGIRVSESNAIDLAFLHVHDVDGVDNDNTAGLSVGSSTNIKIHHNIFHDNYDRTNADTGGQKTMNSRNVVFFAGGGIEFSHNTIFNTPLISAPKTGPCLGYKHSATVAGTVFNVHHNVFWRCAIQSVATGSFNSHIHHNLIVDSDPMYIGDLGGNTQLQNTVIENNTFVNGVPFEYNATNEWGPISLFAFRKNIVVDNGSYHQERAMINVSPYGSDALYGLVVTAGFLSVNSNCYFATANSPRWSLFAANGGSYGVLGGLYDFATWRTLGFDSDSVVEDPQLNVSHVPQNPSCIGYGWQGK